MTSVSDGAPASSCQVRLYNITTSVFCVM